MQKKENSLKKFDVQHITPESKTRLFLEESYQPKSEAY